MGSAGKDSHMIMSRLKGIKITKETLITHWPEIALFIIVAFICLVNYKPGYWFSGWDTLHPEFNYSIYWNRITNSVWQEHQGLGAVATQAHASEIPRVMLLWFFDLFLPTHFVRWMYFFAMLMIGPLGIYYLCQHLFHHKDHKKIYSFLGGLFYLLNLGTLQNFYAPLEMFATLYGFIGFLFLYTLKFLDSGEKRFVLIFAVLSFFSAPMAHTPTLWVVYFILLTAFALSITTVQFSRFSFAYFRRCVILLGTAFLMNSFWILPTAYFTLTHAKDVSSAKITRFVSEEGILNNLEYANIENLALLKGYLFNWKVHRGDGQFTPIFIDWEMHFYRLGNFYVQHWGYLFFGIIVIGIIFTAIRTRYYRGLTSLAVVFLLSLFFLLMENSVIGFAYVYLRNNFPIIKEALRFPYTKFSIPLIMTYAVFFAFGAYAISKIFVKAYPKNVNINKYVGVIFSFMLVIYCWPAFNGKLFGDIQQVKIPDYYFEAYDYLNKHENSRIATLPLHSMYGWVYYDWQENDRINADYQGAGFVWFLSKNPILDREFDRWYPTNEDFYNEFHYAVYSGNTELLKYIFNKYDVKFLIYDTSIDVPWNKNALYSEGIEKLFADKSVFRVDQTFGSLNIYKIAGAFTSDGSEPRVSNYSETPEQIRYVSGAYSNINVDSEFWQHKDNSLGGISSSSSFAYYTSDEVSSKVVGSIFKDDNYLADSLSTGEIPLLNSDNDGFFLYLPDLSVEDYIPAEINNSVDSFGKNVSIKYLYPKILKSSGEAIFNPQYETNLPLEPNQSMIINRKAIGSTSRVVFLNRLDNESFVYNSEPSVVYDLSSKVYSAQVQDCSGGIGSFGKDFGRYPGGVILKAVDKNLCLDFDEEIVNQSPVVYKVSFEYTAENGARPLYCLTEGSLDTCLNYKYEDAPKVNSKLNFSKYEDFVIVRDSKSLKFTLILETDDKSKELKSEFINLKIEAYEGLYESRFGLDREVIPQKESVIVKKEDFPLKIMLPEQDTQGVLQEIYFPTSGYFNPVIKNCDSYNQVAFNRTLEADNTGDYYRYYAKDAIACDDIDTRSIQTGLSYLLTFKTKNISGKGLDICLSSNNIPKCLIEERLDGKDGASLVLPPYPDARRVKVGVGNHSIGEVDTENLFYSLNVRYIPYNWLKGIALESVEEEKYKGNPIAISSSNKINSFIYSVEVAPNQNIVTQSSQNGLLVLNQSFDKGWTIYRASSCPMGIYTPFTCQPVGYEHVLVKNWANGWMVPTEEGRYYIVFWPQYLQFVGYLLILLYAIGLYLYWVLPTFFGINQLKKPVGELGIFQRLRGYLR